jgi:hypothetical protein
LPLKYNEKIVNFLKLETDNNLRGIIIGLYNIKGVFLAVSCV